MRNAILGGDSIDMESKVWLYMDIFGEDPWNEGYICPETNMLYPLSSGQESCTCCNPSVKTNLFYDRETLQSLFSTLEKKVWYQEQIAMWPDQKPIWFIWWWRSDIYSINTEKLWLSDPQLSELLASIKKKDPSFDLNDFYYFAEIGVEYASRWADIAGMLYRAQIEAITSQGNGNILVRTTKKTQKPYEWFLRMWYSSVFDYNDQQDRVILIKKYAVWNNDNE